MNSRMSVSFIDVVVKPAGVDFGALARELPDVLLVLDVEKLEVRDVKRVGHRRRERRTRAVGRRRGRVGGRSKFQGGWKSGVW